MRRAAVYVRYVLGQRVTLQEAPRTINAPRTCVLLQEAIKRALATAGQGCSVEAFYTGGFFEPLYAGMWSYQEKRLGQIIQTTRPAAEKRQVVRALISAHGERSRLCLRVGFYAGKEPLGAYSLNSRPGEDKQVCAKRVTERILAASQRMAKTKVVVTNVDSHRSTKAELPTIPI